jgi:predicted type IV restriction endonuclease
LAVKKNAVTSNQQPAMLIKLSYPEHRFRLKEAEGVKFIFDELRRRWLKLTPEEWVRQHFVQYLISAKKYPSTLIALEKRIRLGELIKRFDILVYDQEHNPLMMVECKSMNVSLDENVFTQILRYNISIPVRFLVITNGNTCYAFDRGDGKLEALKEIPEFF